MGYKNHNLVKTRSVTADKLLLVSCSTKFSAFFLRVKKLKEDENPLIFPDLSHLRPFNVHSLIYYVQFIPPLSCWCDSIEGDENMFLFPSSSPIQPRVRPSVRSLILPSSFVFTCNIRFVFPARGSTALRAEVAPKKKTLEPRRADSGPIGRKTEEEREGETERERGRGRDLFPREYSPPSSDWDLEESSTSSYSFRRRYTNAKSDRDEMKYGGNEIGSDLRVANKLISGARRRSLFVPGDWGRRNLFLEQIVEKDEINFFPFICLSAPSKDEERLTWTKPPCKTNCHKINMTRSSVKLEQNSRFYRQAFLLYWMWRYMHVGSPSFSVYLGLAFLKMNHDKCAYSHIEQAYGPISAE